MINWILTKIVGSQNERDVKKMLPRVAAVNELEREISALSDEALRGKTAEFRRQIDQGATLDDLLHPAFAVAREAARRTLGMRPFDVQLMGGMVLHEG
nr:preprotein translocase subunit SecA [Thermoanaerobaculia bacterium]